MEVKIFNGEGLLHHFLYEIGRVSKTSGWHYVVKKEGNKFIIETKEAKAIVWKEGYHLFYEIEGKGRYEDEKIRIVEPYVFTEVPYKEPFTINGEEFDYISIPGFGLIKVGQLASYVFEAIGKFIVATIT